MGKRGLVMFALVAALFVFAASGCGDSSDGASENAHLNEDSGSTHDLVLDDRVGTPPPPVKETKLSKAAEEGSCFLLRDVPPKKGKPIPPDTEPPKYQTDPPVSGPYVEPPHQQADGAYMQRPEPINVLGALNNGRMAIYYAPDLSEEIQMELKGLYDTMYGATLFFPDDEMDFAVAATTWTNFLGCTSYDSQKTLDALRAFGKATWGKHGGKPVESVPFEGPTPVDPEQPAKDQ
jgi:uncharacterized protein DUF3105